MPAAGDIAIDKQIGVMIACFRLRNREWTAGGSDGDILAAARGSSERVSRRGVARLWRGAAIKMLEIIVGQKRRRIIARGLDEAGIESQRLFGRARERAQCQAFVQTGRLRLGKLRAG